MKNFKKSFLIAAVFATMVSLLPASAFATKSPSSTAPTATVTIVDPFEIRPFTDFLAIDNANLNNGGNSWSQKSGYDYARVFITNTSSQTLNVYLAYGSSKTNIYTGTVSANSSSTISVTSAGGQTFYVDYNTADGTVSGKINVRSSDVPFN